MKVVEILQELKSNPGSNAKKEVLERHSKNILLKKILLYGSDPFMPFNVVKVPRVKSRVEFPLDESRAWDSFFKIADECAARNITGNAAVMKLHACFTSVSEVDESWMRKVLKKHLAIGASSKTINKVFSGLIPTFEIALAQKFEEKRILGKSICVEPKLDGIRCFAIVDEESAVLYARSGKVIKNFDSTIGAQLLKLGPGCYDGELMGEDFISLMRQAYRKDDVDTSNTYLALFDYLPIDEWNDRKASMKCKDRYEKLLDRLDVSDADLELLQPVERTEVESTYDEIKCAHDYYVSLGYEGVMIKDLDAPYKFGRGPEIMKFKAFQDVDLHVKGFIEGTGKHSGKLGSFLLEYNGVDVQVGSGLTDELREAIWKDKENFLDRVIEVRYQEVTPDGSLRFPTFVCFRNDK